MTTVANTNGNRTRRPALRAGARAGFAALAVVLLLAACGTPGSDGQTYVALDYASEPQAVWFPAFPPVFFWGEYYEHAAGDHSGEYIAWDGTYWWFTYTIEIDEGGEAPLFGVGDHGDDYYLSIWLYSFGPSLYQDDVVVRSLADPAHSGAAGDRASTDPQALQAARDRSAAAREGGAEVTVVTQERTLGALTIRLEARSVTPSGE